MENRSRVGDIKKKFEGLNTVKDRTDVFSRVPKQPSDFHPKCVRNHPKFASSTHVEKQQNSLLHSGNKGNIKRSHAFRSEKQSRPCSLEKMVAVENVRSTDHKQLVNPINESLSTKDIESTLNNIGLPDQISSDKGYLRTDININFMLNQSFDKSSSSEHQGEPNNKPVKNKVIDSSSNTEKDKVESEFQPNYSVVLKPSNRSLSSNVQKANIGQFNSQKKIHRDECNNSTANKLKIIEIGGKNLNTKFNKVKSVFENNELDKKHSSKYSVEKNSVNEVLKSPLPKGPPPKKPPRTFAHNLKLVSPPSRLTSSDSELNSAEDGENKSYSTEDNPSRLPVNKTIHRPIRSKTESQIMLKKLEIALLNHQQGRSNCDQKLIKKEENEISAQNIKQQPNSRYKNLKLAINCSTFKNDLIMKEKEHAHGISSGLCFKSLNCYDTNEKFLSSKIYDTPFEPKSSFFVDKPECLNKAEKNISNNLDYNGRSANKYDRKLCYNKEHVYAEPSNKNKATPGQKKFNQINFLKNEIDKSTTSLHKDLNHGASQSALNHPVNGLHYMSTPILDRGRSPETLNLNLTRRNQSNQDTVEAINTDLQILNYKDEINCSTDFSSNFLDKHKIQMMVNEAYGKCLNFPVDGGSDSDSVASTPDETVVKTVFDHDIPISSEIVHKEREKEREQRTAERKGYLRRVCSRGKSFHRPASVSDVSSYHNLFDYVLLVGLDLDPARCKVPYIKAKYPPDVSVPNGIESLCFPDASDWPPQGCKDDSEMGGCYCIVLTNSNGIRKYGYCRRVQPEGAAICLPLAYCVVSPFKDNSFFNKLLVELESHHGQSEHNLTNFIEELYKCPYPAPGNAVVVNHPSSGLRKEIVRRPLDQRQEEVDIARLLSLVRLSIFLQLFGTLLLERKIALLSHSISKLSACVEGLQAALFPFHWQHTLVPVVPSSMIDLCHAPTPYIIGLLKHKNSGTNSLSPLENVDQVLVVDVDDCRILRSVGDESSILPSRLSRGLRTALQLAMSECINSVTTNANLIASEALIRLFVELLGHYRDHIITSAETGKRDFQRESFVKSVNSSSKQHFLDWFTETAMFTAFIEERLDRTINPKGVFEQRCVEYLSDRSHPSFLKSYKGINKTVKTLGDRLKDWAALS